MNQLADPDIAVILVGNKIDMPEEAREVSSDEAEAYANQHDMMYIETSAKSGHNVGRAFQMAVERERSAAPSPTLIRIQDLPSSLLMPLSFLVVTVVPRQMFIGDTRHP